MDNQYKIQIGLDFEKGKQAEDKLNNVLKQLGDKVEFKLDDEAFAKSFGNIDKVVKKVGDSLKDSFNGINLGDLTKALELVKELNTYQKGIKINIQDNHGTMKNLNSESQAIKDFAKATGLSYTKELERSIKENWNEGSIDNILRGSIRDGISKINQDMSAGAKKQVLSEYDDIINYIKGQTISLKNIEFDNTELKQIQQDLKNYIKIDPKGIGIDSLMEELKSLNFSVIDFDKSNSIQDHVKQLSDLVGMYKSIKKHGISAGLDGEQEAEYTEKVTKAYYDLIDKLEMAEQAKINLKNVDTSDIINKETKALREQKEVIQDMNNIEVKDLNFDGLTKIKTTDKFNAEGFKTGEVVQYRDELNRLISVTSRYNSEKQEMAITSARYVDNIEREIKANEKLNVELQAYKQTMANKSEKLTGKYGELVDTKSLDSLLNKVNSLNPKNMHELKNATKLLNAEFQSLEVNAKNNGLKVASQDARSLTDHIKATVTSLGLYYGLRDVIQGVFRGFKEGVRNVVEMDTALTDLSKVVNTTEKDLNNMRDSAVAMGKDLATSSKEIMGGMAEFGRITKDLNEIKELTKVATMGSNVTDLDASQMAKSLNTVILSMKLNLSDAMGVLDQFNELQNNFRVSGVDLADGVGEVGSAAVQAGIKLAELNGYITSLVSTTGISGSEAGTALKSMISRLYRVGNEGAEDAGKAEQALDRMGIKIRNSTGDFKDFGIIIQEISQKWGEWSKAEQLAIAQSVGSTHHYSKFIGLMENLSLAGDATKVALDSQGSAMQENEKYIESIAGKYEIFKVQLEELSYNLINSDFLKETVQGFTSLMSILNSVVKHFGTLGTVVGATSLAFLTFDKTARSSLYKISDAMVQITFNGAKLSLLKKTFVDIGASASSSSGLIGTLAKALQGATIQSVGLKFATIALQSALTFGLSAAIGLVISGISKLINHTKEMNKALEELEEKRIIRSNEIGDLEKLHKQLTSTKSTLDEQKQARQQIADLFPTLIAGYDAEGNALLKTNEAIAEEIVLLREREALKALSGQQEDDNELAKLQQKLDKKRAMQAEYATALSKMEGGENTVSGAYKEQIQGFYDRVTIDVGKLEEKMSQLTQTTNTNNQAISAYTGTMLKMGKSAEEATNWLTQHGLSSDQATKYVNDAVKSLRELAESQIDSSLSVEEQIRAYEELGYSTDEARAKIESLTEANRENAMSGEEMANAYGGFVDKIDLLKTIQQEYNEYGFITEETLMRLLSKHEDLIWILGEEGNLATNVAQLIAQAESDKIAFYENTVIAHARGEQSKIDSASSSATSQVQAVADATNQMGAMYETDVANYQKAAQAKANMYASLGDVIYGTVDSVRKELAQMSQPELFELPDWAKEPVSKRPSIKPTQIGSNYSSAKVGAKPVGVGSKPSKGSGGGGKGSGGGKGGKTQEEKEIEDMEKLTDRYYEYDVALKKVENSLQHLNTVQESLVGKEKIKSLQEEIKLLKNKEKALKKLADEQLRQKAEMEKALRDNGFNVDNGLVTNRNQRLEQLVNNANSKKGDDKKKAQENVKHLEDIIKNYTNLVNDTMANTKNELLEINNIINDIYREQLNTYTSVEQEITNILMHEKDKRIKAAQEEKDKKLKLIQEEKEAYQKEKKEETFNKELKKEQDQLSKLEKLYANLSLDTSDAGKKRAEEILQQINAQKEKIEEMLSNREYENNLDNFDKESEKVEKEYEDIIKGIEDMFSGSNLANLVADAMATGTIKLASGAIVTLEQAFKQFHEDNNSAWGVTGELIQKEFIDKLNEAKVITESLGDILGRLGLGGNGRMAGRNVPDMNNFDLGNVGRSIRPPRYNFDIPERNGRNVESKNNSKSLNVSFNAPLINVQGNITQEVLPTVQDMIEQAKDEIKNIFIQQFRENGMY